MICEIIFLFATCCILFESSYTSCYITFLCLPRLKNGKSLKGDYRIKQKSDCLIIHKVTEADAGNYTMVLTNKITKEEHNRTVQLLVNGMYPLLFAFFISSRVAWCRCVAVWTLDVFLHSASSHYWQGGGRGQWRVPVRQQPHPEVHRQWISNPCTNRVAVDVQRGLSRGLHVSFCSVCVCVKKEQTSFLCMHAVFTCLSVTHCQQVVDSGEDWLLSWCWQKQERRQWDRTLTRCRSADMIHVLHNVHF